MFFVPFITNSTVSAEGCDTYRIFMPFPKHGARPAARAAESASTAFSSEYIHRPSAATAAHLPRRAVPETDRRSGSLDAADVKTPARSSTFSPAATGIGVSSPLPEFGPCGSHVGSSDGIGVHGLYDGMGVHVAVWIGIGVNGGTGGSGVTVTVGTGGSGVGFGVGGSGVGTGVGIGVGSGVGGSGVGTGVGIGVGTGVGGSGVGTGVGIGVGTGVGTGVGIGVGSGVVGSGVGGGVGIGVGSGVGGSGVGTGVGGSVGTGGFGVGAGTGGKGVRCGVGIGGRGAHVPVGHGGYDGTMVGASVFDPDPDAGPGVNGFGPGVNGSGPGVNESDPDSLAAAVAKLKTPSTAITRTAVFMVERDSWRVLRAVLLLLFLRVLREEGG